MNKKLKKIAEINFNYGEDPEYVIKALENNTDIVVVDSDETEDWKTGCYKTYYILKWV